MSEEPVIPAVASGSLKTIDELIEALGKGSLQEHRHVNLELKESWALKHGVKISALANKLDQVVCFLAVGISDDGKVKPKNRNWAKEQEEIVSQHINQCLDPIQACKEIRTLSFEGSEFLVIVVQNPGEVTYWDSKAYAASGTTVSEIPPEDILKLRIQLPGLVDYSKQTHRSSYNEGLVRRFTSAVNAKGHTSESTDITDINGALRVLNLYDRQASRILFGRASYRIIEYDEAGEITRNDKISGLFNILLPEFIDSLSGDGERRYSARALKEALANAVAHAAYFESDGDLIIEIYKDHITISNLCLNESAYFANRWFSRSHKTVNGLLMESLRVAGFVDELGRGKNLIFSESIKHGKLPPQVVIENAGKYRRWKLTLFGGQADARHVRVLERCREVYGNERKSLIALALVLWRDLKVTEIQNFVDGEFAREFAEVLSGSSGPILYSKKDDKIILRRWAEVLLGEGKDSKALSSQEEEQLLTRCYQKQPSHSGSLSLKEIRDLAAMGNSRSEQVLSSALTKKWVSEGKAEKMGFGKYKIRPPQHLFHWDKSYEEILKLFHVQTVKDIREFQISFGPQG